MRKNYVEVMFKTINNSLLSKIPHDVLRSNKKDASSDLDASFFGYSFTTSLRHVVRDQQLGAVTSRSITTVEADEIGDVVIVIVNRKKQSQLRCADAVDIQIAAVVEAGAEPAADRVGIEDRTFDLFGGEVEVSQLESTTSKCRVTHVDIERAKGERTGSSDTALLLDLEGHVGHDRSIGQGRSIKVQDGTILFIGGIIPENEGGLSAIERTAGVAGLRGFEDPAIVGGIGFERGAYDLGIHLTTSEG